MAIPLATVILILVVGIALALFGVTYAFFLWSFQKWNRKNIPSLKTRFPSGNLHVYCKGLSLSEDLFVIVDEAKKKGNLRINTIKKKHLFDITVQFQVFFVALHQLL